MPRRNARQKLETDYKNYDRDGDGFSSHKGALGGNIGPIFISNNVGKLIALGVVITIVVVVAAILSPD